MVFTTITVIYCYILVLYVTDVIYSYEIYNYLLFPAFRINLVNQY